MQGERQRETEPWHSRDWTPPSHVSTQSVSPIYALIQFFTWEQCDVSVYWPRMEPGLQQGAELLETISSAPAYIATFSHSSGPKWHQFLENHQKQYGKTSLTFDPRQLGGIVMVKKISGQLEKHKLLGMISVWKVSRAFIMRRSFLLSLENCKGIHKPEDKSNLVDTDCLDSQKHLPKH